MCESGLAIAFKYAGPSVPAGKIFTASAPAACARCASVGVHRAGKGQQAQRLDGVDDRPVGVRRDDELRARLARDGQLQRGEHRARADVHFGQAIVNGTDGGRRTLPGLGIALVEGDLHHIDAAFQQRLRQRKHFFRSLAAHNGNDLALAHMLHGKFVHG